MLLVTYNTDASTNSGQVLTNREISTQLNALNGFVNALNEEFETSFINQPLTVFLGAINRLGNSVNDADYIRTTVSNVSTFYRYSDSDTIAYTGEITNTLYVGVAYFDSNGLFLGHELDRVGVYQRAILNPPSGTTFIAACSKSTAPVLEIKDVTLRQAATNTLDLVDSTGLEAITEDGSDFDFAVINEDNELTRSPIGISNIRVLSARTPSLSAMIPASSVSAVFTGRSINLGEIFANGNTIFSLTSWFDISTRNGGGNIADGSFEAPTRITQEVFLTFADTSINLANTSQNNEIALFTTEITQEEFKNDTGGGLVSMKVDMSHGIVFSTDLEFSSLIVNHQTFDPLGNVIATDSRTYRGQDSSFNSHPSFGNVLFADHEFILNRRITFEFGDSENTNGLNGVASTTLNHRSTIVEII